MTTARRPAGTASGADDFDRLVTLGDAGRDSGQWADAVRAYEAALALRPQAAGIWVQLGHVRKECGEFPRAEAAYERARSLEPADAELLLQIGHLHASRQDRRQALDFYRQAVVAGSGDEHALHYLARFADSGVAPAAPAGSALPAIYFEYTDLLNHFRSNRNPTGIQRVQIELFRASLTGTSPIPIHACAWANHVASWVAIKPAGLLTLVDLASAPGRFHDQDWQKALATFFTAFDMRGACRFPLGAALVNLGTSWGIEGYMTAIRVMKARYGLRYVPFVHDLIPLVTPEYVDRGVAPAFNSWLSSALMNGDLFAVTSRSTSDDVIRASASVRPLEHAPVAMPLDARPESARVPDGARATVVLRRLGLAERPFALFVGTMEARKNHHLVFQAWKRLLDLHPANEVPTLVCVGKRGWKFEQAQGYLDSHPELDDRIVILSGVSDAELASLYGACLFTIYASLYEGWGLPVTESLCHGKACLTADHSSLPEAGGRFADYYDADSVRSFTSQAQRLIFDAAYRTSREQLIEAEFRPRSWEKTLLGLVDGLARRFQAPAHARPVSAPVALGTTYLVAVRPFARRLDRDAAVAEMLRFDNGWHGIDTDMMWSKGERGRLGFGLPAAVNSDFLVFLGVRAAPEPTALTIQLAGSTLRRVTLSPNESRIVRIDVPFRLVSNLRSDDLPVILHLQADHVTVMARHDPANTRHVGIGIELFMACLEYDLPARLTIMERALMTLEDV